MLARQARQDTTWFTDPANPTSLETGLIHNGERMGLRQKLLDSGLNWQPAR